MFIRKSPPRNGEYGVLIFVVTLLLYITIFDYSEDHEDYYFLGMGCLFFLSFFIENRIVKLSQRRYEELKNDVKEDVLREVLEELETRK